MAGVDERRVRHEVRGREAERAPALVAVRDLAAQLERRAQAGACALHLARLDQRADVRRGDDLAVDLDEVDHAGLERLLGAQQRDVALGAVAEAEVLPHAHPLGAEPPDQHVVDEVLRRAARERAVERDHDELAHAQPGDQVGLRVQRRDQLRRRVGRHDRARVRLERQHGVGAADHLAVAQVHAVELADRDVARPGFDVGEPCDLHQPRKPTTGLSVPSSRGSASAISPSASSSRTVSAADGAPGTEIATPCPARLASSPASSTPGRKSSASARPTKRPASATPNGPIGGPPQLEAVRVAEIGDQRAHVGARAALDRERRPLAVAPELLEPRHLDLALGDLDRLARACQRVGALPADAHRGVGRRPLAEPPGRERERLGRHPPGLDLAVDVPGGRREAQPRDRLVALGQRHQEALRARRPADQHEQQPGRERVERARVPDLRPARQLPPLRGHHVVRGDARGLVDEQDAVGRSRGGFYSCSASCLRRNDDELAELEVGREAGRAAVPAAALRPRDHRDVDAVVGRAQRDLAPRRRALGQQLAHESRDGRALDRAQVVDDALGEALVGARERVVGARELGQRSSSPPSKRSTAQSPRASSSSLPWGTPS